MTSVVFVHGTGVRIESYEKSFIRVSRGMAKVRPDAEMVRCYWGDTCGASLGMDGASIPVRDRNRGVLDEPPADDPTALWAVLLADPLAELRAYAAETEAGGTGAGFVPGRRDPWEVFAESVRTLPTDGLEVSPELAPYLHRALGRVASELDLLPAGSPQDGGVNTLTARAVTAVVLHLADEADEDSDPLPVDGADRDTLVEQLAERFAGLLGGTDRALGRVGTSAKWLGGQALQFLLWDHSELAVRYRRGMTGKAVPATGDILRYQARGADLRSRVADTVRGTRAAAPDRPVVLIAHSLGGIACVDLLAMEPSLKVDLLVTVGSQAPFLYEMDALTGLRRGEPLPDSFPRWLNVYDDRDLLGFVASKVFPGKAADHRVDTRQPFPWSHSAYFAHRKLYDWLGKELP
ncbi:hypothetical protein [Streptomyces sp. NPDC058595]|uniref:hypothetical protein n=1 Tax=Streptomyces sp. NPDC058595 TaxID=3346550 RepID=UPI00365EB4DF